MPTMLEVIQDHCGRANVPVPSTVYGSADPQVVQMMRLLEEEGNDLSGRGTWQGLVNEASMTTLAAEDQGAITSLATNGFRYIVNDTIWDRANRLPVCGPLNSQQWQTLKGVLATGPRYQHRFRGDHLLVNPSPSAGLTWYFEYVSKNWILNGSTYKRRFTADNDTILLPDDLCLQGLRWRWKKEKGFDYAEDFRTYETQVKDALGRDGGKPILRMDNEGGSVKPGIWVPQGSWPT